MPLTMLAWSAWFFVATGLPASTAGPTGPTLTAPTVGPVALLVAGSSPTRPDERSPLWYEAEDEDDRDDDSESATPLAFVARLPAAGSWSNPAARARRLAIRPRSALRSPILRC